MLIEKIIGIIEEIAPLACQAEWDKSGPQVANLRKETDSIAVCLDPLPQNIKKAAEIGAGFLLSHHPLSLKPALPAKLDNWYWSLKNALTADIFIYSAHTSLDTNIAGPAGWLARELGLIDVKPLESASCNKERGFGGIGHLPRPEAFEALLRKILVLSRCQEGTICGKRNDKPIKTLAWCGGSGASLIDAAFAGGADLFVTGDVKYHAAREAPIPVLDIGHHAYEEVMMEKFADMLTERLPQISVNFIPSSSPFTRVFQEGVQ